jgi:hypothetical protein
MEGNICGLILKYSPSICLERLRKTMENLSWDGRCPKPWSKQGAYQIESEAFLLESVSLVTQSSEVN